jgi:RecB family endonuclease NucS
VLVSKRDYGRRAVQKTARAKQNRREHRIEKWLWANIGCLEPGLKFKRKQVSVRFPGNTQDSNPGRIDIIAKDKKGATVVVELKAGKAGRRAIGQILGYMGALMVRHVRVRGILVAGKFSPQGLAAARPVPTLTLKKISGPPFEVTAIASLREVFAFR